MNLTHIFPFKSKKLKSKSNNVAKDLAIAFLEYRLLYVNAIFEIIALMKPVQLKDSSVSDAIDTPNSETCISNSNYTSLRCFDLYKLHSWAGVLT